ncbi:DUF4176 domain-containing protein [Leucobacter insecticola]|uniref:DUF4176 domain-containing protein n=1 Tax=Leucobacter insecticola TaxID=2714934 RepID=A0A6G8FIM2_9MICO|nr:DUF4176 domain-containing protein [Leucobacter insecticola]QIM16214.1 DUF4176 domain-containing protein [Leucobacter insecticola]
MSEAPVSEMPELLPLGSAVQIEDDEGTFVIIARGFQKDGDGFLAGYKSVPYPQGAASGVREIVIRQNQISKVLHRGYEGGEEAGFAKDLLKNAKAPRKVPPVPVGEPDLRVDLAAPAAVATPAAPLQHPEAAGRRRPPGSWGTPKTRLVNYDVKEEEYE